METHFDLTDSQFTNLFESCELDPALFTHEAHLRLAWIYIRKYGVEKAIGEIQSGLRNYVESVGAKDKYHATLTVAAMKIVYRYMQQSETGNFRDFISRYPRLKNNFRDLIDRHYGVDIFSSEKARLEYVGPDLLPF